MSVGEGPTEKVHLRRFEGEGPSEKIRRRRGLSGSGLSKKLLPLNGLLELKTQQNPDLYLLWLLYHVK